MARSQYQYQPLTGPVFIPATLSVAASLAWLPSTPPPAQRLPPRPAIAIVAPFTAAIDAARNLSWLSLQPLRVIPLRAVGTFTVLAPFQPQTFDPATFPRTVTPYVVRLERRSLGGEVAPFLTDVAIGVQADTPQPIRIPRNLPSWTILSPLPIPPAGFDPALLSWVPASTAAGRLPPRLPQTWSLLSPLPIPPAFNPALLQWMPSARAYPRSLPRPVRTWSLLDPRPLVALIVNAPLIIADQSAARYRVVDASGLRFSLTDQGVMKLTVDDQSEERYPVDDQSAPKPKVSQ